MNRYAKFGTIIVAFVAISMLMSVGTVMASEEVDMTWSNVEGVNASVSNGESVAHLGVSAGATGGQFKATVGTRVEVESLDADFNGVGSMTFHQYNDFYGSYSYGEGLFTATIEGETGGVNIETRLNKGRTNVQNLYEPAHGDGSILYATGDHEMYAETWYDELDYGGYQGTFDKNSGKILSVDADASSGLGITRFDGGNFETGNAFSTFYDGISADGIMEGGDSGFNYSIEFDK